IEFDGLSPKLPRSTRNLLRRCLERNVQNRLRDIGEARIVLENLIKSHEDELQVASTPSNVGRSKLAWVLVAVLAIALTAVAFQGGGAPRLIGGLLIRLDAD